MFTIDHLELKPGEDYNEFMKEAFMQPEVFAHIIHEVIPEAHNMSKSKILKILKTTPMTSMTCCLDGEEVELNDVVSFKAGGERLFIAVKVEGMTADLFNYHDIGIKTICRNYRSFGGTLYLFSLSPTSHKIFENNSETLPA